MKPVFPDLVSLLSLRAREQPRAPAFTFLLDGEQEASSLDYGTLHVRASQIAAVLRARAEPGARVLLLYPYGAGLEFISAFFGCLYAKMIAVPAYPPDPARLRASVPRLEAIIAQSGAALALCTSAVERERDRHHGDVVRLANLPMVATDTLTSDERWVDPSVGARDVAFLQYTSGSTGAPKGVVLRHANAMSNLQQIEASLGPHARSVGVSWLPLYHDMGLIGMVLGTVHAGMHSVLISPLHVLQKPVRWLRALSRYHGTHSGAPNFGFEMCLYRVREADLAGLDLSSWHVAFVGAEPVRVATLRRFSEKFAAVGFEPRCFHPCYGLAEATLLVTGETGVPVTRVVSRRGLELGVAVAPIEDSAARAEFIACGRAVGDLQLRIVSPVTARACVAGEIGEIWVGGGSIADSYWDLPSESLHTFHGALPDEPANRYLRTGDLGFVDEAGRLYVTGRAKDVVVVRGRKLHATDLELTAEISHAALRKSATVAFSVEADGDEHLVLIAAADLSAGDEATATLACVREAIVQAHEVNPHTVLLVRPGAVLKTSSGKVQRQAMRAAWIAGRLPTVATSVAPGRRPLTVADFSAV